MSRVDKEFPAETKTELFVIEVVVVDKVDKVDEYNAVDKYKDIAVL